MAGHNRLLSCETMKLFDTSQILTKKALKGNHKVRKQGTGDRGNVSRTRRLLSLLGQELNSCPPEAVNQLLSPACRLMFDKKVDSP